MFNFPFEVNATWELLIWPSLKQIACENFNFEKNLETLNTLNKNWFD
jgi:hypothetical protein